LKGDFLIQQAAIVKFFLPAVEKGRTFQVNMENLFATRSLCSLENTEKK
jgi:hypothetical protein